MQLHSNKIVFLISLMVLSSGASTWAQPRRPETFFQPDKFFQEMFGEDTEQDRAELQKVQVSLRDETQLGNSVLKSFTRQLKSRDAKLISRGDDVEYLRSLVNQLRPLMKNKRRYRKINVLIADTSDADARSFPGGTLVIFRGLIDFCETEAALVGILGHELSHIDCGHQLYHVRRWKLAEQTLRSGKFDPSKMMSFGSNMAKTFMRPFRPEEETEADFDGARWAFQLGYNPAEMAKVFLRLHERDGAKAVPISFLRSHPFHHDRYTAILKEADKLTMRQPNKRLYAGAANLEKRVPRKKKQFPE